MTKRKKPPAQQLPSRHETAGKSDSWAFSLATVAVVTVVLTVAILIPILTTLERGSRDHQLQPHGRESKENPRAQMLTPTKQTPYELLKKLNTLAYNGDLSALKALITSHRDIDWNSSLATDAHRTPIHYALQGRQDSFVQQSSSLIGQHEEVISYLIAEGYLSGGHGCPVYYAIHLRNTRALATLLKAGDRRYLTCHGKRSELYSNSVCFQFCSLSDFPGQCWRNSPPLCSEVQGLRICQVLLKTSKGAAQPASAGLAGSETSEGWQPSFGSAGVSLVNLISNLSPPPPPPPTHTPVACRITTTDFE